jgi:hypothetical protein
MLTEEFAALVRRAAEIHSNSWSSATDDYSINIENACKKACKEHDCHSMYTPLYYVLDKCWNDVIDWADTIRPMPKPKKLGMLGPLTKIIGDKLPKGKG